MLYSMFKMNSKSPWEFSTSPSYVAVRVLKFATSSFIVKSIDDVGHPRCATYPRSLIYPKLSFSWIFWWSKSDSGGKAQFHLEDFRTSSTIYTYVALVTREKTICRHNSLHTNIHFQFVQNMAKTIQICPPPDLSSTSRLIPQVSNFEHGTNVFKTDSAIFPSFMTGSDWIIMMLVSIFPECFSYFTLIPPAPTPDQEHF